jgi:hypothetical protein
MKKVESFFDGSDLIQLSIATKERQFESASKVVYIKPGTNKLSVYDIQTNSVVSLINLSSIPEFTDELAYASCYIDENQIFICGGSTEFTDPSKDCYMVNVTTGDHEILMNMKKGRKFHCVCYSASNN